MATTADRLSATACVGTALSYIAGNFRDLLMIATPPVVGLTIVDSLVRLAVPEVATFDPGRGGPPGPNAALATFGVGLLNIVLYVMFAVAWHRKYLLPDERVTVADALKWRREKTRFLLRSVGISLVAGLAAAAVALVGSTLTAAAPPLGIVVMAAATLIALVLFGRLSLILPAAAVGRRDFGFQDAWRETRGNALAMVLILLLPVMIAFIAGIPAMIVALLFGSAGLLETVTGYAIVSLIGTALNYVAIAIAVTSLSEAYYRLIGPPPAFGAAGGPGPGPADADD